MLRPSAAVKVKPEPLSTAITPVSPVLVLISVATSLRVELVVKVSKAMVTPFKDKLLPVPAVAVYEEPVTTFGDAVAVTPVVAVALLIAAAIAIALAAFVELVMAVPAAFVSAEAGSSAVEAATMEVPLIRNVPACNKPVVVVDGAADATARSTDVMADTLALYVPAVIPAFTKLPSKLL